MEMDRHDLAYLNQSASVHFWDDSLSEHAKHKVLNLLQDNVPLTVCRQDHVDEGHIKLAISCFVEGMKYRIALTIDQSDLSKITRPIELHRVAHNFSELSTRVFSDFIQKMKIMECDIYVYGSYAYEYLTKEHYVNVNSDLDIVLYPKSEQDITAILNQIQKLKQQTNICIDGDIKIHPDWHVSFNELIKILPDREQKIIAKGIKRIGLFTLKELLG